MNAPTTWSSRSLGSRLQHAVFHCLIAMRVTAVAQALLRVVVLYYSLLPSVRRRSAAYVQRRFGTCSLWRSFVHTYRLYLTFGKILLLRAVSGHTRRMPLYAASESMHNTLTQVLTQGKGCIVLSAHVGAWHMGLAALEKLQTPLHMVQWRDPQDVDKHTFEYGFGKPIAIIDSRKPLEALVQITAVVRRGEVVIMMGDRLMPQAQKDKPEARVCVNFLGGHIAVPITPYVLASATGAPIVCMFTLYDNGMLCPTVPQVLTIPQGLGHRDPTQYHIYAQAFVTYIEEVITSYPYQFFNFYNLWVE